MFLRATAATLSGALLLAGCGGGGGSDGSGSGTGPVANAAPPSTLQNIAETVSPAVAGGPYSAVLADCAFNPARATACTLGQLPFIGSTAETITVDDVMRRVVTSKPWMAQRVRELLLALPNELLQMLRPVTAIVVAGKIRPSFYWGMTGAIYIDPQYLWTTPQELADVDKTGDYRTTFGDGLQFATLWRYVKDGAYAYKIYPLTYTGSRTLDDIKLNFAHLLAHEATHAGDFVPPRLLAGLPLDKPLTTVLNQISDQSISTRLYQASPLTSPLWQALAGVMFLGNAPTQTQAALKASEVWTAFSLERATDDYAYTNAHEDAAMLAEEALMRMYFGVERDFAISPQPTALNPTAADYIVTWGTRGRIGQAESKRAAALVVSELFPTLDFSAALAAIPAPKALPPGTSWKDSLVLNAGAGTPSNLEQPQGLDSERPIAADRLRPH